MDIGADEYYVKVVAATIDINPDTLNLKSIGKWVTIYIELPKGYKVEEIDCSTIRLEGTIKADSCGWPLESVISDYDDDGILDMMVKFDRKALQALLTPAEKVELKVTGELIDGTPFEGSDVIRVRER